MKKGSQQYKEYLRKWRENNKERVKKYRKEHKEYFKNWREANKDYPKKWKRENKYRWKKYNAHCYKKQQEWIKRELKLNPKFRLDMNIRYAIWKALKGKKGGERWEKLVGYTLEDLIIHLEKQFDNKMTLNNYSSYWEIDHIKPKSLFHYENSEDIEFKKCWALNNLQPLEISKNRSKSNKF